MAKCANFLFGDGCIMHAVLINLVTVELVRDGDIYLSTFVDPHNEFLVLVVIQV